jgi:hypothetical protein
MPKTPVKPKTNEQWADCPRSERAKVPGINLDIKDLLNPCELARQSGVSLSQLRAIPGGRDSRTGLPVNDFVVPSPVLRPPPPRVPTAGAGASSTARKPKVTGKPKVTRKPK